MVVTPVSCESAENSADRLVEMVLPLRSVIRVGYLTGLFQGRLF